MDSKYCLIGRVLINFLEDHFIWLYCPPRLRKYLMHSKCLIVLLIGGPGKTRLGELRPHCWIQRSISALVLTNLSRVFDPQACSSSKHFRRSPTSTPFPLLVFYCHFLPTCCPFSTSHIGILKNSLLLHAD